VLAGRRAERSPEVDAAIAEIAGLGAELATEAADVSDARAVADLLARIQARGWALRGVFHAAGTLDDGPLASQTPARFAAVLAPKLAGAWRLAEACPDLDAFVAFSSAAAWLGPPGQGPYAAANAALDAFMRRRRGHGLPALTVNWGPWAGAGMASGLSGRQRSRLDARGVRRLSDAQALGGLGRALSAGLDQLAIIDADWPGVRLAGGARLLDELGPAATPAAAVGSLKQAVRMAEPARRRAVLEARLVELVAQVLGFTGPAALRIDVHAGLFDIGLDSLSALELRNALQTELAAPLSATLAFRHPTIAELADGLLPLAGGAAEPLAPSPDEAVATRIAGEVAALTEAELESMIDFEYRRLTTR
jgi:polyketide synthase 12/epothilone polyketide synthase D